MISITSENSHLELLKSVPDFTSWDQASKWLERGKQAVQQMTPSPVEIYPLGWENLKVHSESPFGLYSAINWRKFVLATFLADLASYPTPVDQVNFERLLFVMHAFPQGFRIWWAKAADQLWWPLGYTGWYPMLENMYELMRNHPEKLKDRMVVPNTHPSQRSPLYLFNFSVVPAFKNTPLSKALMKGFLHDIASQKAQRLACITVSEDGVRIAQRLGMSLSGSLIIDGCSEGVYVG